MPLSVCRQQVKPITDAAAAPGTHRRATGEEFVVANTTGGIGTTAHTAHAAVEANVADKRTR